jgi:hypothetical protein
MKVKLVIQSFGNENEYRRAVFCIISMYARLKGIEHSDFITSVYTDSPSFFAKYLSGLPVNYVALSTEEIRSMRGELNFLHRMKISVIENAFKTNPEVLFYVDSDAFFIDDAALVVKQISDKVAIMHTLEYQFDSLAKMDLPAGKPFHAFLDTIDNGVFVLQGNRNISVSKKLYSWNAGVIVLHSSGQKFLDDVYSLTDQFYLKTMNHASEQYAFSVILQKNVELRSCEDVVFHYWYRVKKNIMDDFLSKKLSLTWSDKSLAEKFQAVTSWTQKLPKYLKSHPLTYHDNAIQAFHRNEFFTGYRFASGAMFKGHINLNFVKDILYHTRRLLLKPK